MNKHAVVLVAVVMGLVAGVGSASAEDSRETSSLYGRLTLPDGSGADEGSAGECKQISLNMWSCWACDENEDAGATLCGTWYEDNDGKHFDREVKEGSDISLKSRY